MVLPAQLRAARALLGWSQKQLAQSAKIGVMTVKRHEAADRRLDYGNLSSVFAMIEALRQAGVEFLEETDGGGAGVRFRKPN